MNHDMKTNKAISGLITVAALAVLVTLIGAQPNPGGAQSQTQQLGGTWSYTVDVTGVPSGFPLGYKSLITFDSAGGLVQTAWAPPVAEGLAGLVGVSPWIGHGEWVRTGNREFALTVLIPRFAPTGKFAGIAKARSSIRLNATGREVEGIFQGDIFDVEGNLVVSGFGGTVRATRLQLEPLQ